MKTRAKWSTSLGRMIWIVAAAAVLVASPRFLEAAYRFVSDTTVYAPGFTDAGFQAIRPGMGRDEVQARLGTPIATWQTDADRLVLSYSRTDVDGSYYMRRLVIGEDAKVTEVVAGWYQD